MNSDGKSPETSLPLDDQHDADATAPAGLGRHRGPARHESLGATAASLVRTLLHSESGRHSTKAARRRNRAGVAAATMGVGGVLVSLLVAMPQGSTMDQPRISNMAMDIAQPGAGDRVPLPAAPPAQPKQELLAPLPLAAPPAQPKQELPAPLPLAAPAQQAPAMAETKQAEPKKVEPPEPGPAIAHPAGQVDKWINEALKVLQKEGYPLQKMDPASIRTMIQNESNGDPEAINNWDSNAAQGTPSKGLMQVIDPTFKTWALPGHNKIKDPVDNIIAGVRYSVGTYGSISNVPGVAGIASGGSYQGY